MIDRSFVLLAEIADVLGRYQALRCAPAIETTDEGGVVLTVSIRPEEQDDSHAALNALELYNELQYVVDVGNVRGFATRYGISPAEIEALLPPDGRAGLQARRAVEVNREEEQ